MSLFEWIGEQFNAGPVGTMGKNENQSWQPPNRFLVWLITLLGIGLFIVFVWQIFRWEKPWQGLLLGAVYLLFSWLLSPRPDTRNMGWLGGVIDHPFRISDDLNRWLLFFALLLLPGKVVLYAFQTLVNTFRLL